MSGEAWARGANRRWQIVTVRRPDPPDRRESEPRDEWERGFDDGWAARLDGRKPPGLPWRLGRLVGHDPYRSGWWEGFQIAGGDE